VRIAKALNDGQQRVLLSLSAAARYAIISHPYQPRKPSEADGQIPSRTATVIADVRN
jgi:hypothetical protein